MQMLLSFVLVNYNETAYITKVSDSRNLTVLT